MPYRRKKLTFAISSPDEFLFYDDIVHEFGEIMQNKAIIKFGKITQNKGHFAA